MKTALDIATIVFMLTVAVGVVLLGRLLVLMLFRPHPIPSNPWPPELASVSMQAANHALERTRLDFYHATGKEKERLGYEVRRLEGRIAQLQLRVHDEQAPYRHLGQQRIGAWKEWRALRDELIGARKHEKHDARHLVLQAEKKYRDLDARLRAAHERYDARDRLLLEELIAQGVLKTEEQLTHDAKGAGTHAAAREPAELDAAAPAHAQGAAEHPAPPVPSDGGAESGTPEERHAAPLPARDEPAAAAAAAGAEGAPHAGPAPAVKVFSEFDLHQGDFADPASSKQYKRYRDPSFDLGWTANGLMSNVDLAGSSFAGVRFQGLHRYRRCNFQRANLQRVVLLRQERPHQFALCNFREADFSGSRLAYMVFSHCDLSRSRWQGAQLDLVKFVGCKVEGVDWRGVDLHRTVMSEDMLAAADFSTASRPPKNHVPPGVAAADTRPMAADTRPAQPAVPDTGGAVPGVARAAAAARPDPVGPSSPPLGGPSQRSAPAGHPSAPAPADEPPDA
ncbi:MAG: pentapeptide repeat-containing protein [Candidatus Lambdaproteobacteria bacterium]|nr:pentapeptide repeat-containing protein [Candidatus Lambdaproteobacteria bacterium]